MSSPNRMDICAYCGQVIDERSYACGRGRVHGSCLDAMKEPAALLAFIKDNLECVTEFLDEHRSDDFLNEFWTAFREDYGLDIERWATS